MPKGFRFPDGADLWVPRELYPPDNTSRTAHNWHVFGRVREGVALSQARAELSAIAHRLKQQYGQDIDMTDVAADRLRDAMTSNIRAALLLLLGAVSFLLLVACANVANLLLAQAARRDRELAIRAALGADRRRLVWQFLIESALLCTISAIIGALAARWGVNLLLALAPRNLPRLDAISLNMPVLLFAVGLSCVMATALGTFTAMRATSGDVRDALAEGGREQIGGQRAQRFSQTIVAGQLAITLVLLVGAGLLGRSLVRVLSVEPGFRTEHVITMDLVFASLGDKDAEKALQANKLNNLFARLRAIPGVEAVGGANALPLVSDFLADGTFLILNPRDIPTRMEDFERLFHNSSITGYADYCVASEDYFRVLAIPLLRGRLFDDRDVLNSNHVAVINDALARTRWPIEDPLGKTIEFGNMDGDLRLLTIVGVVGDARNHSLEAPPSPTIYVNYRQRPQSSERFTIVMRTGLPPESVIPSAREIVRSIDPDVPPQFRTFAQVFTSSLAARRFNLNLVLAFAGAALLLAVAGLQRCAPHARNRRPHGPRSRAWRCAPARTGSGDVDDRNRRGHRDCRFARVDSNHGVTSVRSKPHRRGDSCWRRAVARGCVHAGLLDPLAARDARRSHRRPALRVMNWFSVFSFQFSVFSFQFSVFSFQFLISSPHFFVLAGCQKNVSTCHSEGGVCPRNLLFPDFLKEADFSLRSE